MPSALEKLVKILKLERSQGFKDTAVIGGLSTLPKTWTPEAHKQARKPHHHLLVDDLSQLMESYSEFNRTGDRQSTISYMLDRVMGRTSQRDDYEPRNNWDEYISSPEPESPPARSSKRQSDNKQSDSSRSSSRGRFRGQDDAELESLESDIQFVPTTESDLPTPPRLQRPPRQPRHDMPADEAADIMRGMRQPITVVKGVGNKLAQVLSKVGVNTVEDMLFYLPRRYDDYTRLTPISHLEPNITTTVVGTVQRSHLRSGAGGRQDFAFELNDGTGRLSVVFFGQHFLRRAIRDGMQLVLSGTTSIYRETVQLSSPEWEPLEAENLQAAGIVPVYRLTKGLNAKRLRNFMRDTVNYWANRLPDYVPASVLDRTDLADLGWTLKNMHFPESFDHLHHAQRRFIFDELLLMQLAILGNRREWQSVRSVPVEVTDNFLNEFVDSVFPYVLTSAQVRVIDEIRQDLAKNVPMNRLVQGDVGSGKTAVAEVAISMAVANGLQAALMAPTSILAEQHYRSVSETLAQMTGDLKPTVALLTGAMPKSERDTVYAGLADGSLDVVIGTHALIQEGVEFKRLALAIIDEQHRFGVEQRGALRGKGFNPHLLVMTATPIPRTLALTMYADLDLSVIDEMPPGRTPIKTQVLDPVARERSYDFIKSQLDENRQAFIVHPLVEASDKVEAASAVEAFEELKTVFFRYNVGLLHGRMNADEKDAAMRAFADHEIDVLVTTSVAEVGVNIPNASVMMIEGANRFGLSQLHQFRGRVGRGLHPGYCLLVPDKHTAESGARLKAMEETSDGFVLAELDWELRGAGDLLSVQQSGVNKLQLQNQMNPELVELAQREARTLCAEDPDLNLPEHQLLRQRVDQLLDDRSDIS